MLRRKVLKKFSENIIFIILFVLVVLFTLILSGCSDFSETVKSVRDPDMKQGCYVTEFGAGFNSYFKTTNGKIDVCRLNCSSKLPDNFYYKYSNPRTGCVLQIGNAPNAKR